MYFRPVPCCARLPAPNAARFSSSVQRETNSRREAENSSRLLTVRSMTALFFQQREEFRARPRVFLERAEQTGSFHDRVLFLDSAHHHAEMFRFHHDRDTIRLETIHQRFGD